MSTVQNTPQPTTTNMVLQTPLTFKFFLQQKTTTMSTVQNTPQPTTTTNMVVQVRRKTPFKKPTIKAFITLHDRTWINPIRELWDLDLRSFVSIMKWYEYLDVILSAFHRANCCRHRFTSLEVEYTEEVWICCTSGVSGCDYNTVQENGINGPRGRECILKDKFVEKKYIPQGMKCSKLLRNGCSYGDLVERHEFARKLFQDCVDSISEAEWDKCSSKISSLYAKMSTTETIVRARKIRHTYTDRMDKAMNWLHLKPELMSASEVSLDDCACL